MHTEKLAMRLFYPYLINEHSNDTILLKEPGVVPPPVEGWNFRKQSQWMILSRDVVEFMRHDSLTMELLAWAEFTLIPDEWFFSSCTLN
jgi:hypothetical protein